jgi:hypothetical protein
MRWIARYQRVAKKFAIFPVKAYTSKNRELVFEHRWLETVYLNQHKDWLFGVFPIWRTDAFATKREYELYLKYRKEEVSNG